MNSKKRILVAPLNWGLGHATRCIPVINALMTFGYDPVIASDGQALALLSKEYPALDAVELPSYSIAYPRNPRNFKLKMIKDGPRILRAINKERRYIEDLVQDLEIKGIISDNRLGARSRAVPSVIMTHQLNVISGSTTWLSSWLHQEFISKFDVCWVPDHEEAPHLTGKLGHEANIKIPVEYIGPLSRFEISAKDQEYDMAFLLSGPEPQRSLLEELLLNELENQPGNILLVRGVVEETQSVIQKNNLRIYNYMTTNELEEAINGSGLVISRSGYTSIMDLSKLAKKAFFIPTPGQFEQEYLAKRMQALKLAPHCAQKEFRVENLKEVNQYSGLGFRKAPTDLGSLFGFFEGK